MKKNNPGHFGGSLGHFGWHHDSLVGRKDAAATERPPVSWSLNILPPDVVRIACLSHNKPACRCLIYIWCNVTLSPLKSSASVCVSDSFFMCTTGPCAVSPRVGRLTVAFRGGSRSKEPVRFVRRRVDPSSIINDGIHHGLYLL